MSRQGISFFASASFILYYLIPLPFISSPIIQSLTTYPFYHLFYLMALVAAVLTLIGRTASLTRMLQRVPVWGVTLLLATGLWSIGTLTIASLYPYNALWGSPVILSSLIGAAFILKTRSESPDLAPSLSWRQGGLLGGLAFGTLAVISTLDSNTQMLFRTSLALGLFTLPGVFLYQLLYLDQPFSLPRAVTLGFAIAVTLNSTLFLIASLFNTDIRFVMVVLALITLGSAALVYRQRKRIVFVPVRDLDGWQHQFLVVLVLVCAAMVAVTAVVRHTQYQGDYETYAAYTLHFATSSQLLENEIVYATGNDAPARFMLSFQPAFQAVVSTLAGVHPRLMPMFLSAALIVIALLCLYELLRALEFERHFALMGLLLHIALLFFMFGNNNAGVNWVSRTVQDKVFVAFIFTPILVRLVFDYLQRPNPRLLLLYSVICFGTAMLHPTIMVFTAVIVGGIALIRLVLFRTWRVSTLVVVVMAINLVFASTPLLYLRAAPERETQESYTLDAWEEQQELGLEITQRERQVLRLEGTRFLGINPVILLEVGYAVFVVGCGLSLIFARREPAAQYLLAAGLLLMLVIIPYSGWLIANFVTPFQLWRTSWLMPLAVAAVLIIREIYRRFEGLRRPAVYAAMVGVLCFLPLSVLNQLPSTEYYFSGRFDSVTKDTLPQYFALGQALDTMLTTEQLIYTERGSLLTVLPSISVYAKPFYFRGPVIGSGQAGISVEAGQKRGADFETLKSPETGVTEWLNMMRAYQVQYVVTTEGDVLEQRLNGDLKPYAELVTQVSSYKIYQLSNFTQS